MPTPPTPGRTRLYRGASPEQRQAERRTQLIKSAIRVYGEKGYRLATVKAVCEAAGLTERYFYESFANSEELLVASFQVVSNNLYTRVVEAARTAPPKRVDQIHAMLFTYFSTLRQEPVSARMFLLEIRGVSRAVDEAFEASLLDMGERVAQVVAPTGTPPDPWLMAGVLGGIMQIATRWISQGYAPSVEHIVAMALQLTVPLWKKIKVEPGR